MRDWIYQHHRKCRGGKCRTGIIGTILQGVENARLELSAPKCRGGKCRTGIVGTILQGVENAGPSSYGKPKHVVVAAHRKSSVQLFVGINNVAYAFILVA